MVTLESYPVEIDSGITKNTFAGFEDVELTFKREDIEVLSVTAGANNTVIVTVLGDLTNDLAVGNWVYLYSTSANYTYDISVAVLEISVSGANTLVRINTTFIETSGGGYMNYFQGWFLESQLVDASNSDILVLPDSFNSASTAAGEVSLNVNIPVDTLMQNFTLDGGELQESRVKFKVKWRESYLNNLDNDFNLIDDYPIIIIFAAEGCEAETVVSAFDTPIFHLGYPSAVFYCHSDSNADSSRVSVAMTELDINKRDLVEKSTIRTFNLNDYGLLQVSTNDISNVTINDNSQFVKLSFETTSISDFDSDDFDNNDFLTI